MPLRTVIARRSKREPARQTSLAALLPQEIIIAALNSLAEDSEQSDVLSQQYYPYRLQSAKVSTLHVTARVCKAWQPAATTVLYSDVYVSSVKTLRLLLRTLTAVPRLRALVQSFKFLVPPVFPRGRHKMEARQVITEFSVLRLCALCPRIQGLRLGLVHPFSSRILTNDRVSLAMVTTLHIVGEEFVDLERLIPPHLSLPALTSLSLESVFINTLSEWPHMPQLHTLRLISCYMDNHGPMEADKSHQIRNLRRLDLISVYTDPGILSILLCQSTSTLESLYVLRNRYSQVMTSDVDDFSFLTSLRCLCLNRIPSVQSGGFRLPPTLRQLIVWEHSAGTQFVPFLMDDRVSNSVESLMQLLALDKDAHYPCLEAISIRGEEDAWALWREHFTQRCMDVGVHFALDMHERNLNGMFWSTFRTSRRRGTLRSLKRAVRLLVR